MNKLLSRRDFIRLTGGATLASILPYCSRPERRPNFVFIVADDLGWTDLGCYGSTFYETPNLDRLAARGMRFTDAYASCPVCSPTRASIMTGKYPARLQLTDWIKGRQHGRGPEPSDKLLPPEFKHQLELEEVTIAEALKESGYSTGFIGKWHLGEDEHFWPEFQGFEVNIGGWRAGAPYYRTYDREKDKWSGESGYFSPYRNPRLEDGEEGEYLTDRLTNESINFIRRHKDQPFYVNLAFYTVHNPMHGKPERVEYFKAKAENMGLDQKNPFLYNLPWMKNVGTGQWRERIIQSNAEYAAMVYSLDENVGRLMDALDELDLTKNTVIMFTSDNGGLSTSESSPTANLPLRGGKGWLYEGGIREPLIVRWPGHIAPGTVCNEPVTSTDFYPTMLEIAGLSSKPGQHVDGKSVVPLLNRSSGFERGPLYWHYPHYSNQGGKPGGAIRVGQYKLIEWYEDNSVELYNLELDYSERFNLSEKMPEKTASLHRKLADWRNRVNASMPVKRDSVGS